MTGLTIHDDDEFDLSEAETYFAPNLGTESNQKRKDAPVLITPPGTKKQKCSDIEIQAATDECTRFLMDYPEELLDDDSDDESVMAKKAPVQVSNLQSVTDEYNWFLAEHPEELLFNDSLHTASINTKRKDAKDPVIDLRGSEVNSLHRRPTKDEKKATGLESTAVKYVNPPHCDKCLAEELKAIARGEFEEEESELRVSEPTTSFKRTLLLPDSEKEVPESQVSKPATRLKPTSSFVEPQIRPRLSTFKYDPDLRNTAVAHRKYSTDRGKEEDESPASRRCLAVAELLEQIILYLDPVDIFGVQRVNSLWRDTVLRSWPLRRKMHFVPQKFFVRAEFNKLVGIKCESKLSAAIHPFRMQLYADRNGPAVSLTLKTHVTHQDRVRGWEEKFSNRSFYHTGSWRDILMSDSNHELGMEVSGPGKNARKYKPKRPLVGQVTLGKVIDEARYLAYLICRWKKDHPSRPKARTYRESYGDYQPWYGDMWLAELGMGGGDPTCWAQQDGLL